MQCNYTSRIFNVEEYYFHYPFFIVFSVQFKKFIFSLFYYDDNVDNIKRKGKKKKAFRGEKQRKIEQGTKMIFRD